MGATVLLTPDVQTISAHISDMSITTRVFNPGTTIPVSDTPSLFSVSMAVSIMCWS